MRFMFESGRATGSVEDEDWNLDKGTGERTFEKYVDFTENFSEKPHVVLGIAWVDINKDKNSRLAVSARDITKHGFSVEFKTYGDTIITGASVEWLAYGA